jgi:hypothetical protein
MLRFVFTLGFAAALALGLGCRPSSPSGTAVSGGEQPEPEPEPEPEQPPPVEEASTCNGEPCESPRRCISYYGIAGPSGPLFHACEIPCELEVDNGGCPDGMRCVTIADGPGNVCQ